MNLFTSYLFLFTCFIANESSLFAQKEDRYILDFHPQLGHSDLVLDSSFHKAGSKDSIRIETLRFYISGVEFLNNSKTTWKEKNSFHLLDASKPESFMLVLNTPEGISFNAVKFNVGIDSATNVSGAMAGDLDPTRGMYWTWQSGYVNFRLTGVSNRSTGDKNEFQFHLGGYAFPFKAVQTVKLNVSMKEKTDVLMDIEQFLDGVDMSKQNHIMSPGKEAVLLSQKVSKIFHVKE